jgi:hypothetical protein
MPAWATATHRQPGRLLVEGSACIRVVLSVSPRGEWCGVWLCCQRTSESHLEGVSTHSVA